MNDGEEFNHVIWVQNPLRSNAMVDKVVPIDPSNEVTIGRPWNIREKLAKDKNAEDLDTSMFSPMDFWRIEPNQRRPIGEVNYKAMFGDSTKRHLKTVQVKVTLKQNVANSDSTVNKELYIPLRFFKRYSNPLIEEEMIDLGIITSKETSHRYNLFVENRFGKPAVITKVEIEKFGVGIVLKVATIFGYKIVLPTQTPAFELLTLIVFGESNSESGYITGNIHVYLDVADKPHKITTPFRCAYLRNVLSDDSNFSFEISRVVKDGKISSKYEGNIYNRMGSDLVISDLYFTDFENNKNLVMFTPLTKNRRISSKESVKSFYLNFNATESYFDNHFSRGYEIAVVSTLESSAFILIKYYTLNLMCGVHTVVSSTYEKCKPTREVRLRTSGRQPSQGSHHGHLQPYVGFIHHQKGRIRLKD
jgi:hypothetical protein